MNAPSAEGYSSPWMDEELAIFRETASRFVEAEMVPNEERGENNKTSARRSGARPAPWGFCARM